MTLLDYNELNKEELVKIVAFLEFLKKENNTLKQERKIRFNITM